MSQISRQDIIADEALEAPLVLAKNLESAVSAAKDVIATAKQYNDILGTSSKTSSDHTQRTKELTDEQRVLAQITKQVATESAKQNDAYQFLLTRKKELVQQTKEMQGISAEEARLINSNTASIDKLTQAISRNKQAYAQLRGDKERDSEAGRKLQKTIQDQSLALERLQTNLKLTAEHGETMADSLEKIEVGGYKAANVLNKLVEAGLSGWTLLAAGVGAAAEGIKLFFERTEAGEIIYENALTQLSVRFDQFKNRIAEGIRESLPGDVGTEARTQRLRASQIANLRGQLRPNRDNTELLQRIKELEKEYALTDAITKLTIKKKEDEREEAGFIAERVTKLAQAASLEIEARESADRSVQERLEAITKADALYKQVQERDLELAKDRAALQISEINLRAQGRELLVSEISQIQKIAATVDQMYIDFDKAARRRIQLIQSLKKELQSKPSEFINYTKSGVENLGADRAKLIQGLLGQYGITATNDLNKLKEDLGKKSLDELKKILEDAKKLRDEDAEKEKERVTELEHRKNEIIQAGANAAVKIVDDQFEHQIAAHEFYLNQTRENYQEEMQMANGNKLAQAQLTKEFRDRERREQLEIIREKRKQAQFERDIAILTIINKTREAAAADLAKYQEAAGPFIAFDIAMGAIQEAAVLAKPLPSYDVGVDSHPGGPALVHPGELLTYHDQMAFTPSMPTIMDLPQGTQVDTAADTMRLLALAGLTYSIKSDRKEKEKMVEQLQAIREELKQTRSTREDFHAMMAGYYSFKKESEVFAKRIMVEKFGR